MRLTMLVLFLSLAAFGQQPPEGPPPGGPPPGKRMPMPEPKNLKLLKPEHLMETMQSFRVALGVRCDFCHVQNDFASDEKPHKEIARKMIVMSREINQFPRRQDARDLLHLPPWLRGTRHQAWGSRARRACRACRARAAQPAIGGGSQAEACATCKEHSVGHNLRWTGQEDLRIPPHIHRSCRREHARGAAHQSPQNRGSERARRSRARPHRPPRAAPPEAPRRGGLAAPPKKRDIGGVGKLRGALAPRPQPPPVE